MTPFPRIVPVVPAPTGVPGLVEEERCPRDHIHARARFPEVREPPRSERYPIEHRPRVLPRLARWTQPSDSPKGVLGGPSNDRNVSVACPTGCVVATMRRCIDERDGIEDLIVAGSRAHAVGSPAPTIVPALAPHAKPVPPAHVPVRQAGYGAPEVRLLSNGQVRTRTRAERITLGLRRTADDLATNREACRRRARGACVPQREEDYDGRDNRKRARIG
jgi:hypothetical protein